MRRFVLMWVCFGLSFPAWAGLLTAASCCPSQAAMAQQIVDAAQAGETLPDCCNDLTTYLQTGQTCKTSAPANMPLLDWPVAGMAAAGPAAQSAVPSRPSPSPLSAEPEGIWRPPL